MKNILLTLFLLLFSKSFSQNPVFPLDDYAAFDHPGSYRKDTRNELDKFTGTWRYADIRNNKNFTIILIKAVQVRRRSQVYNVYEDLVYGDYQYTERGTLVVSTYTNLDNSEMSPYDHSINGNTFRMPQLYPPCIDCATDERRLRLIFKDPEMPYLNSRLILRYSVVLGVEKLEAELYSEEGVMLPDENSPTGPRVSFGKYTLIKMQ